jgi:transposase
MPYTGKISPETKAYAKYLRVHANMSFRDVARECKISARSVQRCVKPTQPKLSAGKQSDKRQMGRGRPRKISPQQERYLLRELKKLRVQEGTFTIGRLMSVTGISPAEVSRRTVLNVLHRNGYRFRQTRRKGLLKITDLADRLKFAKKMIKRPATFWTEEIAFYLDAVSIVYKRNPLDQARAPKSRIYRQKSEGLARECTSKGRKEGTGGKYVKLNVAISHGHGVIICEPYEQMCGAYFAQFIDTNFRRLFNVVDKGTNAFVQDGDPSQNSYAAREAMKRTGAQLVSIPPRSPDINGIENVFHLLNERLRKDAIERNLSQETYDEFQERVISTIHSIPQHVIDNVISSTKKRLQHIINGGGKRTKY